MPHRLLRTLIGIITIGIAGISLFVLTANEAQAQFNQQPTCPPNQYNVPIQCTYPGGQQTTCTISSGFGFVYTCTNPDGSTTTCQNVTAGEFGESSTICSVRAGDGTSGGSSSETTGAAGTAQTQTDAQGDTTTSFDSSSDSCSLLDPFSWFTCATRALAGFVLGFASFLLGIAGVLFNWVIVKTVFEFSTLIGNSAGLLTAWGILRDIGNMLLLFGFIFIGLAMILDLHSYPAKRTLPRLIIFAVLMNFSLFAAEAVIDVSNGLSSILYTQAQGDTDPCLVGDVGGGEDTESCAINYGVAGHIMQSTGISSIFTLEESVFDIDTTVLLGLAIFATIAAVVLFAAAIMLVIRAVTLTLLMVVAPLGFAAMAIPPLEKVGKDWWHRLINQSFFAPIMLLMFFVSLKITETLAEADTRGNLAAALTNQNAGIMGVIMVFTIVIAFLIASLMAAKKFGAMGADLAVKTAGSVTYGTIGFAGRRTFGRASGVVGERIRASNFGRTEMGRRFASVADYGSKASFDLRATPLGSVVGKYAGSLGKAQQGGYDSIVHRGEEARKKYSGSLKQTEEEKAEERRLNSMKSTFESQKQTKTKQKEAVEKAWKQEREDAQDRISKRETSLKNDNDARMRNLDIQATKVKEAENETDRQREQEELDRLTQYYADLRNREQADIDALKDSLRKRQEAHETAMERANEEISRIDTQIKGVERSIKGGFDDDGHLIVGVGSQAPKQGYAKNLHEAPRRTVSAAGRARHHAYDAIVKDLKRSKSERVLDEIKDAVQKAGGDVHDIAEKAEHAAHEAGHEEHGGGGNDHGGGGGGGDHGHH